MRRFLLLPVLAIACIGFATVGSAGATASAPYCGIYWGSLLKSDPAMAGSPVFNLRTGRHTCYDRLVVDLAGPASGYRVEYVTQVVQDGSGEPIPLAGGAFLQITINAPGYDEHGQSTYSPADPMHAASVTGYSTFRQVAWAGSFEGYSTIGLGVRARLPMRVFVLAGPGSGSRVVIDVAHQW